MTDAAAARLARVVLALLALTATAGVLVDRAAAPHVTDGTRTLALALFLAAAITGAFFVRSLGVTAPVVDVPGWRWLDPGGALIVLAGVLAFPLLFLAVDALALSVPARGLAFGVGIAAPLLPWVALKPREEAA